MLTGLRGRRTAAPLKLDPTPDILEGDSLPPRSKDRGSIETTVPAGLTLRRTPRLRGRRTAAPLKLNLAVEHFQTPAASAVEGPRLH